MRENRSYQAIEVAEQTKILKAILTQLTRIANALEKK